MLSVSGSILRRNFLLFPPRFEQCGPPLRIAYVGHLHCAYPVGAEMAEPVAQLAPADDDARFVEEAERQWPDGAPGVAAGKIAIGDGELALGADGAAQERQVDPLDRLADRLPDEKAVGIDLVAQVGRQHGGDLGERIACCRPEPRIGASPRYPALAENQ